MTSVDSVNAVKAIGAPCMGKYVLGWILGVPVIVLVVIYMLFH